jgi:hypothetical protein
MRSRGVISYRITGVPGVDGGHLRLSGVEVARRRVDVYIYIYARRREIVQHLFYVCTAMYAAVTERAHLRGAQKLSTTTPVSRVVTDKLAPLLRPIMCKKRTGVPHVSTTTTRCTPGWHRREENDSCCSCAAR